MPRQQATRSDHAIPRATSHVETERRCERKYVTCGAAGTWVRVAQAHDTPSALALPYFMSYAYELCFPKRNIFIAHRLNRVSAIAHRGATRLKTGLERDLGSWEP